ncbi:MAG TPA: hypothetical protein VGP70_16880 [Actinomadura sp.]|jgi:hypothetical protein|nr:hypothetical protein [Actinomadura sp.]
MKLLQFRALVTIGPVSEQTPGLSSMSCSLVIRAHRHRPELIKSFKAMIYTDDDEPLRPGDAYHSVTMTVIDEDAMNYLVPGEHFQLWARCNVGHGVVSRRVLIS